MLVERTNVTMPVRIYPVSPDVFPTSFTTKKKHAATKSMRILESGKRFLRLKNEPSRSIWEKNESIFFIRENK